MTGVLAAVDSRGEWERGGGEVSWESSFTVSRGTVIVIVMVMVEREGGRGFQAGERAGGLQQLARL